MYCILLSEGIFTKYINSVDPDEMQLFAFISTGSSLFCKSTSFRGFPNTCQKG